MLGLRLWAGTAERGDWMRGPSPKRGADSTRGRMRGGSVTRWTGVGLLGETRHRGGMAPAALTALRAEQMPGLKAEQMLADGGESFSCHLIHLSAFPPVILCPAHPAHRGGYSIVKNRLERVEGDT